MDYNIAVMRSAKKHRVRLRLKVRNRIAKKTGAGFAAVVFIALIAYGGFRARSFVAASHPGETFAFKMKVLDVKSPSALVSGGISDLLKSGIGRRFSPADAKNLELALRARYPALSRVEVRRSLIGGRVTVLAYPESVVAKVRLVHPRGEGGEEFYLAENGRLLKETYGPAPADAFETAVYAGPGESLAALAGFLKEIKGLKDEFSSRPVSLRYRRSEGGCLVTLENSAEIFWGEFEFTRSKIAKLNEVLKDAAQKIKGPLKVDFRYFRDGKVFVSKAADI
ncbi:MAG: hypothetical protein HY796_07095 [Elusimicrobia bacterium]|nr:hypothetical protein [Elusimicrobiota bacterium]